MAPPIYSIDEFSTPDQFTQQIITLQEQLPAMLHDFKRYYILSNKSPENSEYNNAYQNIEKNLIKINSDIFTLSNNIQSNIDELNTQLSSLASLIGTEKTTNTQLTTSANDLKHNNNATIEMISDYSHIYESDYLRNWAIFLSILVAGLTISKVYSSKIKSIVVK